VSSLTENSVTTGKCRKGISGEQHNTSPTLENGVRIIYYILNYLYLKKRKRKETSIKRKQQQQKITLIINALLTKVSWMKASVHNSLHH
jgi:hypothetical protein